MAEQSYELMHKDDVVASLQLDDLSGAILKVTPGTNPELLPLGGSQGADSLRKWWLRRAVPISQGNIAALLQREGIPSTQSLLVRNLGLSLSDHYWIRPQKSDLTWREVSPFSNAYQPVRNCVGAFLFAGGCFARRPDQEMGDCRRYALPAQRQPRCELPTESQ